MFGKEAVVTGGATREDGRFLNDRRNYRQVADYSHDPIDVDVDELIDRTEAFVTDLESQT